MRWKAPPVTETSIRAAINHAALELCDTARHGEACYRCRQYARDVMLAFLSKLPPERLSPVELRLLIVTQGSDG
jgi:bacterioferritin-associated ferredoxin